MMKLVKLPGQNTTAVGGGGRGFCEFRAGTIGGGGIVWICNDKNLFVCYEVILIRWNLHDELGVDC